MPRILIYALAALAVAAFPSVAPNDFYLRLGQDIAIASIAAMGLNLLLGYTGQLSLGQAGFLAIGAYGSAILATNYGVPMFLSFLVGLLAAALAGMVMGLVALRTRTHYLAMATLAFGFIVEIVCQRWVGLTGGSMGLIGVPMLNFGDYMMGATYFFWIAGGTYLAMQILMDYTSASATGRALKAMKESESFALTVGMNVHWRRAGVFVVSAVLAGLAGILFAHQSGYVSSDAFGLERSIGLLIAVVIGGLGHPYGAVLGTTIVVILNQLTASLYEVSAFIFGGILLAVMLFFPAGAAGALDHIAALFRRRRTVDGTADTPRPPLPASVAEHAVTTGGPVLEVTGLRKAYAGVVAVKDVSFAVAPGTIHALIGPNGAGKSTLINLISGLYRVDAGTILYRGEDVTPTPANRRAERGLARTFQNLQLVQTMSVVENVMLGLPRTTSFVPGLMRWLVNDRDRAGQRAEAMSLLAAFGIARFADALPGDLAYGHRKLCELARALAQRPTLMLLDEPIAGLNEREAEEVTAAIHTLRETGVTVLLVEHNMPFVMGLSDTVTVLDHGETIAEGPPAAVQRDPAVIAAYLGTEAVP